MVGIVVGNEVDATALTIVGIERRPVRVGKKTPLDDVGAAGLRAMRGERVVGPRAAVAVNRVAKRIVAPVCVVVDER